MYKKLKKVRLLAMKKKKLKKVNKIFSNYKKIASFFEACDDGFNRL